MKPRILIVGDDAALRATLARWLLGAGYAVELSESVHRAREVIANESVNLAILAPRGMGAAGAQLGREIGERIKHVILVIEAAGETAASAELAIQSTAAISWPCSEHELLARVSSEMAEARVVAPPDAPSLLRFEGYTLDAGARTCLNASGQEVTLTRAEFSLLLAFARQPGRVLSRDELTHVAAGRGAEPDDRSVDVLISRLRRKIEPDPKAPRLIVTMPGEGYKFTAKPQVVAAVSGAGTPSLMAAAPSTSAAGDGGSADYAPAPAIERPAPRLAPALRVLVPATIVILAAGLGWAIWRDHASSSQIVEVMPRSTASQPSLTSLKPGDSAERRAAVFKRMLAGLQGDRFTWRSIERLAVESGVDEAEAREILAEHPDEVVLGKSRDGKLLARLSDR
jgi:DNA-binding response OmpR family regulator